MGKVNLLIPIRAVYMYTKCLVGAFVYLGLHSLCEQWKIWWDLPEHRSVRAFAQLAYAISIKLTCAASWVDPGYLQRGFKFIKGCSICWFYLIFLISPWKWNNLVSKGGLSDPLNSLDPPLWHNYHRWTSCSQLYLPSKIKKYSEPL